MDIKNTTFSLSFSHLACPTHQGCPLSNSNVILLVDLDFFFTKLNELAPPRGCRLNSFKTRILTSTNGSSPIPSLRRTNPALATSLQRAINSYSISKASNPTDPPIPVEIVEGYRLLGAPVGSAKFAREFCFERVAAATADAHTLTSSVSNLQTRLRLFIQCTIHKLPHLLGYDVLHHLPLDYNMSGFNWEGWEGPLIDATNHLMSNFLKQLLNLDASLPFPSHSLYIAQGGIPAGGLGLYRPGARAIPDFVLSAFTPTPQPPPLPTPALPKTSAISFQGSFPPTCPTH